MQLDNKYIRIIEENLNIKLPDDYKKFICNYGYLECGIEIYGLDQTYQDINSIPSVIAATKIFSKHYPISNTEIVISHTNIEDIIIVLDTCTSVVYEKNKSNLCEKIATSFSSWFTNITNKKL